MDSPDFRQQICGVLRQDAPGPVAPSVIVTASMDGISASIAAHGWHDAVSGEGVSGPGAAMFVVRGQLWLSLDHDDRGGQMETSDFWYDWDARRWTPGVMPED